tara:strand:+ start:588 stop:791 length:204 start_codon:yes stop_codon:yes gene_type:complete
MNRSAVYASKPAITDAPTSNKANHICLKSGSNQTGEMVSETGCKYQAKGQWLQKTLSPGDILRQQRP